MHRLTTWSDEEFEDFSLLLTTKWNWWISKSDNLWSSRWFGWKNFLENFAWFIAQQNSVTFKSSHRQLYCILWLLLKFHFVMRFESNEHKYISQSCNQAIKNKSVFKSVSCKFNLLSLACLLAVWTRLTICWVKSVLKEREEKESKGDFHFSFNLDFDLISMQYVYCCAVLSVDWI